jgi:hypothetical protein
MNGTTPQHGCSKDLIHLQHVFWLKNRFKTSLADIFGRAKIQQINIIFLACFGVIVKSKY